MDKEKSDILKKELQDKAPGLSKTSGGNPFEVPENYFAGLPEAVQQLKSSRAQKGYRTIFEHSTQRILAYAAALAVLVVFGLSVFFLSHKEELNDFAGLENEYIESYFAYIAEYDEAHYYDLLLAEGNGPGSVYASYEMIQWGEDIEDDTYFEYLLDNMELYDYLFDDISDNY